MTAETRRRVPQRDRTVRQLRSEVVACCGSIVSVPSAMARCAAWFELVGDGPERVLEGRVVVEFEEVRVMAVDTLVAVRLHDHSLLSGRGVAASTRGIDRTAFGVVDQQANERAVELAEHGMAGRGRPIIKRDAVTTHVHDDFGGQVDVAAQEQRDEGIGSLLSHARKDPVVGLCWLPPPPQVAQRRRQRIRRTPDSGHDGR